MVNCAVRQKAASRCVKNRLHSREATAPFKFQWLVNPQLLTVDRQHNQSNILLYCAEFIFAFFPLKIFENLILSEQCSIASIFLIFLNALAVSCSVLTSPPYSGRPRLEFVILTQILSLFPSASPYIITMKVCRWAYTYFSS